jgi:hypothetical protein
MFILSMDFSTVGQTPNVYSKDLFMDELCFFSTQTYIHNERVAR